MLEKHVYTITKGTKCEICGGLFEDGEQVIYGKGLYSFQHIECPKKEATFPVMPGISCSYCKGYFGPNEHGFSSDDLRLGIYHEMCAKIVRETSKMDTSEEKTEKGVENTIAAREYTHGDYSKATLVIQLLKNTMRKSKNWREHRLTPAQRESLDQIQTKIGRILGGDPNCKEHWHDIIGYARLIEKDLK